MERRVVFTKKATVTLQEYDPFEKPLNADEIEGHTVCSLISAGTEINASYFDSQGWNRYPKGSGYAAVFRVENVGADVTAFQKGDLVMGWYPHCSFQRVKAESAVALPEGLDPKAALFARISAVPAASLYRLSLRPGSWSIVVVGLGNVGIMAMQLYSALGYEVVGTDIDPKRVEMTSRVTGLPAFCDLGEEYSDHFGAALECSGTQQGTLECCRLLRPEGELALVGVPWNQTGDVQSYFILNRIFYKYLHCFSGWECDLPINPTNIQPNSRNGAIQLALRLLKEGKMHTQGLYNMEKPDDIQNIYDSIAHHTASAPSVILDWQ